MQLRNLGASGLAVTPLGLGLAALGRPGYLNLGHAEDLAANYDVAVMRQRAYAVLDAAWAAGVRYFDAARSYGRAEEFLGGWLHERQFDPAAVTVGSKWGYTYTAGWQVVAEAHEVKAHELDVFERQLIESQVLLTPYFNLYQIHSATLESGVLDNLPVLTALARLKAQGVAIGLSVSGPRQAEVIRRALAVMIDGVRLFDCVQATWNLLETSAGPALAEAHAAGVGVIVKEALANGRLTDRNADPALAALDRVCAERSATRDALALAVAMAQPWADVVLSGAASVAHLQANLRAGEVADAETAASALAALVESPAAYWATRARLAWN
ncbi:aldo/keto reductase [Candidatus Chloroploca asiatica]|uniref:Aldo/keto reductase n=1 Tax=Candidatus Chloroploca asiatica TaxID=1506545 RepID=A0A2H3KRJ7_9CHLR|nr:aldo/keto reductase [Candidatus Chloroploca asiatica]PDW00206.1 aldo/keto reductase [Candidatus Chloroploca asiatica]